MYVHIYEHAYSHPFDDASAAYIYAEYDDNNIKVYYNPTVLSILLVTCLLLSIICITLFQYCMCIH